jgi:hypothetical protein
MSFRSVAAEATHRHAFPALCRKPREPKIPLYLSPGEWGVLRATIDHEVERIAQWVRIQKRYEPGYDVSNQEVHPANLRALQSTIATRWERRFLAPARRAEARNGGR